MHTVLHKIGAAMSILLILLLISPMSVWANELPNNEAVHESSSESIPPNIEVPENGQEEIIDNEEEENISETDSESAEEPEAAVEENAEEEEILPDFSVLILTEVNLEAEFLEFENQGETALSIQGLEFSELSGSNEKRHAFSEFTPQEEIAPQEFLVLSMQRLLNNSGETIGLYAPKALEPFSTLEVPSSQQGKSYSLLDDGSFAWQEPTPGTTNVLSEESPEETPPAEESPEEIPPDESGDVEYLIITEIDLAAEFIEIFNIGDDHVLLENLQFSELSGGKEVRRNITDFTAIEVIEPQSFLLLSLSSTLNNSGETIRLYADAERTEYWGEVQIPALQNGKSYARNEAGEFAWTAIITPGAQNIFEENTEQPPPETPDETGNEEPVFQDFSSLFLNEVDLHAEFIELFNGGMADLNLQNFQFSEMSGENEVRRNFQDFQDNIPLPAGTFLTLSISGKLNNSGERIRIYTSSEEMIPLADIRVPALAAGQSYARNEENIFSITTTPTPNAVNILTAPPPKQSNTSTSKSAKNSSFFAVSTLPSLSSDKIEVLISEVAFKDSQHDRIELFCQKCETPDGGMIDLQGFQIFDDAAFFEFPQNTFVQTGNFLVIILKSSEDSGQQTAFGWEFQSTHTGLTGTDETLMLIDGQGRIEDALCWTDRSGKFSTGEEKDLGQMHTQNEWSDPNPREHQCFPSQSIRSKMSAARLLEVDTNTAADFFPTAENTFGAPNPPVPDSAAHTKLVLQSIRFFPETGVSVEIMNASQEKISLHGWTLWDRGKKIYEFPKNEIISSQQSLQMHLWKKIPSHALLELQDPWLQKESALCFTVKDQHGFWDESEQKMLHEAKRIGLIDSANSENCPLITSTIGGILQREESIVGENRNHEFLFREFSLLPMTESTELFISAVLPNPKGKDEGAEWLEISSLTENVDITRWKLQVGNAIRDFPSESIEEGETQKFFTKNMDISSLRNTAERIQLLSPLGEIYFLEWENAKDDAILRVQSGEVFWEKRYQEEKVKEEDGQLLTEDIAKVDPASAKRQLQNGIQIASVLPNPEGKDSDQEQVLLRNTSAQGGWIIGWQLSNGKTKKKLPDIFLRPHASFLLEGKEFIPQLRNTDGRVILMDHNEFIHSEVTWEKARDHEFFGPEAPIYKAKVKKSTAAKKKVSVTQKSKADSQEFLVHGILKDFSATSILLLNMDTGEQETYLFAPKNPQHLFFLSRKLQKGNPIVILLSPEAEILGLEMTEPWLSATSSLALSFPPRVVFSFWLTLLTIVCCGFLAILWRKREYIYHEARQFFHFAS